jgi:lysophospholipid acyltransferase (LPLAT)-like uncharacterized protein
VSPAPEPVENPFPEREPRKNPAKRLEIAVLAFALRQALRLLRWTNRLEIGPDAEALLRVLTGDGRALVAFWHAHLALVALASPGRLCVQVSRHADGEIVARAVAPLGIRSARGSATRGGVGSLREMLRAYAEGYPLAVVVDGPRGPRLQVKPGVVRLAAATGAPVYPVAAMARRAWFAPSWDRLVVPVPPTRIHYAVAEPVRVAAAASGSDLEEARLLLERRLREAAERACRRAGRRGGILGEV